MSVLTIAITQVQDLNGFVNASNEFGKDRVLEMGCKHTQIAKIIMEDGNSIEIAEACREEGFNNLHRSALIKVKNGLTSLDEVDRVTSGH